MSLYTPPMTGSYHHDNCYVVAKSLVMLQALTILGSHRIVGYRVD